MTDRRLAILVAVAVVGGAAVAGVGLATEGSTKPRQVLHVDETTGSIGRVVLDETRQNVVGALGPAPHTSPGFLLYPHVSVKLRAGRVVSIRTDDPAAETEKVVRIGDPISAARASYRKAANCVPNSPDKSAKHSYCRIKVPAGSLFIDGDPIASMTLSRTS
jgi:hypothetical protein